MQLRDRARKGQAGEHKDVRCLLELYQHSSKMQGVPHLDSLSPQSLSFFEPVFFAGVTHTLTRAKGLHVCLDTSKAENTELDFIGVVTKLPPGAERRVCSSDDNNAASLSFEVLINTLGDFVEVEGKARNPHAIKETFENGRHRTPPVRVDNDYVICPTETVLKRQEVGLKRLNLFVALVEDWVKLEFANIDATNFVSGVFSARLVMIGHCAGVRLFVSVS